MVKANQENRANTSAKLERQKEASVNPKSRIRAMDQKQDSR